MSENAIDSENTNKPALDTPKSKGVRKSAKNGKPPKKTGRVQSPVVCRLRKACAAPPTPSD